MESPLIPTVKEATALLVEAAQGMKPEQVPVVALHDRLVPYRNVLREYRRKGFSVAQLVTLLRSPKIGIEVSPVTVRKFIGVKGRKKHAAKAIPTAPNPATSVPQKK